MRRFLLQRIGLAVPTVIGAVTFCFFLVRLLPGNPARVIAGPQATPAQIAQLRNQIGLNGTWIQQYLHYLGRLLHGNLGYSSVTGQPVLSEIAQHAPYTIELAACAIVLSLVIGVVLGTIAASRRATFVDSLIGGLSVIGVSVPVYWTGLILVTVFAVQLRVLPAAGATQWQGLVLPSVTLCLFPLAFISRQTRSAMAGALSEDYSRTALAKGVSWPRLVFRHALRNAAIPILTVTGLELGQLLGGAILTETVFAWPGIGQLLVQSISSRDFEVVQGVILVFSLTLILVNLATDVGYILLEPRLRHGR
jgi:ABC-type dipeptide/oligopeptide/nickel transport system permease component